MTGAQATPDRASAAAATPAAAREAVLLVNVRSRRGAALHGTVRRMLEQRGLTITAEHLVTDPAGQLPDLVPRILAEHPPLLVVGSGDGTIATVVDHLAHTDTVLGYLPLGTTNNFGRSLGLPPRLRDAIDVVVDGRVAHVDLGRVNGDWFANLVSIGVSAEVAGRTPHLLKRHLGRAAYAATAARTLRSHRPFTAEVRSGDTTWRVRTHQLNIANGRMHGGSAIARDASLEDRLLVVYALGGSSRFSTAWAAARQALTPWQPVQRKGYLTGTEFHITTDVPLTVDVDGEVSGMTPIHVEVTAQALRVMAPRHPGRAAPGPASARV
ncbi:diacylglycerol/lipid kinase family protein [Cellulomonas aerilata]|uniref:Diacylglycerol kinase n=1 Tax=Cellulomonas aerilata TaxID=515326 RepID=A0A512D872_9CELL|nr:YegS/Rv2252/BmrU family lipid kinase [Cellulomonas aerilata]GEO32688.1 diacylglycerol kinase [Cellulomonas aerilata]